MLVKSIVGTLGTDPKKAFLNRVRVVPSSWEQLGTLGMLLRKNPKKPKKCSQCVKLFPLSGNALYIVLDKREKGCSHYSHKKRYNPTLHTNKKRASSQRSKKMLEEGATHA